MCKETKREFFRVQGKNSRPLPHIFTRPLALHSQISSPITCRHTARRSDPYHDQSARAILGTAFKGTRRISSQGVFRLQAVSGHGTGNTASWTPIHWPHRGEHPIRGYRSWFAGPVKYRIRGKAYLALCACSLKQGLFLEVLPNLATSEFLRSLKRLIARRGCRRRYIPTMAKPLLAPKSGSNKLCVTRRHKTTYHMRTSSGNSTSAAPPCGEDSLSASSTSYQNWNHTI